MKNKSMVGILAVMLVFALFVAADGYIKTQSGDIILDPAGGLVTVKGASGLKIDEGPLDMDGNYLTKLHYIEGKDDAALSFYAESSSAASQGRDIIFITRDNDSQTWDTRFTIKGQLTGEGTPDIDITYANLDMNANNITAAGNIISYSNNTYDLGSPAINWDDVYYSGELGTGSVGYVVPKGKSAVKILSTITTNSNGQLDHSNIDESLILRETDYSLEYYTQLRAIKEEYQNLSREEQEKTTERDIAIQRGYTAFLNKETQEYELISISKLIIAQQEAIKELRNELCNKDITYKFC